VCGRQAQLDKEKAELAAVMGSGEFEMEEAKNMMSEKRSEKVPPASSRIT
jgi:hypothetical protein